MLQTQLFKLNMFMVLRNQVMLKIKIIIFLEKEILLREISRSDGRNAFG